MIPRARQIEIEIGVIEMLEEYGIALYPMSISRVAEALGIELIPYSSLDVWTRSMALAASEDAFSAYNDDFTVAKLAFNDTDGSNFNRSRFSGGHEIGHIFLEHDKGTSDCEAEADYFAGYLLAPHPLILTMPKRISIAERFGISQSCADFARDQADARHREGDSWRPQERWLLEHAEWKGGGLLGRA